MSNKTKVIISVTNDLVTDQRVNKVATSLINNNFDVLMIGRKLKNSQDINRAYKTKRFKLLFNKGALFYAEYNIRLFFFLLFHNFDILNSNDLDTLAANYYAAKIKGKKLVYDSHEYFTEVPELVNRPKIQNIWLKIESHILPKLKFAYTVSDKIAEVYKNKYKIEMQVIKNLPKKINISQNTKNNNPKIILYQGALNINRGIETAIKCMQNINNAKLLIAGSGDIETELKDLTSKLKLDEKVVFLGKIPLEKLNDITITADLGVSLEENIGHNYKYALPNKLFDYINAEISVLVSNLPEMAKIINEFNVGEIVSEYSIKGISKQISNILESQEKISKYTNNCKKAKEILCWEQQEKMLLSLY